MTTMQCKLCNQKITSVILDKEQSYPDCMAKMTKHLQFMHKEELTKFNSETLPKAIGMFGGFVFTQEFVHHPDQPNIGWIEENVNTILTTLLAILGYNENEDEDDDEGDIDNPDTETTVDENLETTTDGKPWDGHNGIESEYRK